MDQMERFFTEKCTQLEGFVTQYNTQLMDSKNMSFNENEAMFSLIQKKKHDDSSMLENNEVRKLFQVNSNLKKEGGKLIGSQVYTSDTPHLMNPYDRNTDGIHQPYVPEVVGRVGNEQAKVFNKTTINQETVMPNTVNNFTQDSGLINNYVIGDKSTSNQKANNEPINGLTNDTFAAKDFSDKPPSEMYGSGIRIRKNSLKDSIGNVSLTENGLLEYFIDERGFLVDQNGCPIFDELGKPIQLTEENINYLKNQNLFEEVNE